MTSRISLFLRKILPAHFFPSPPAAEKRSFSIAEMDIEKRVKLDRLCAQLLSKKTLITSGKLQFMGLSKIKRRLGKEWAGLSKLVYKTAEEVLNAHLDKGDIFIRYHDEAYVLLFARATKEEAMAKAAVIAEEIRKSLFKMDEKQLREVEIRQAISELKASSLKNGQFVDFLDTFAVTENSFTIENAPPEEEAPPEKMEFLEVDTASHREVFQSNKVGTLPEGLIYSYLPLWDVRRSALTTYLCLAHHAGEDAFNSYKNIYKSLTPETATALDMRMLKTIIAELAAMQEDGRKFLIVCPVQNDTLHRFENYEQYKDLLQQIRPDYRQFLVFLVIKINDSPPQKDPYWFVPSLQGFCRHVFVEVPLRRDINFNYLKNSNIDVVGLRLDTSTLPETEIMTIMNAFGAKVKVFKIPQTFVLGVSSLSLTTSAVCAGYNYIGGSAIHDYVARPDIIHKFKHEDLFSHLMLEN